MFRYKKFHKLQRNGLTDEKKVEENLDEINLV